MLDNVAVSIVIIPFYIKKKTCLTFTSSYFLGGETGKMKTLLEKAQLLLSYYNNLATTVIIYIYTLKFLCE